MMTMTAASRCGLLFLAHFTAALLISQTSYSQPLTQNYLPSVPDSISVPEQRASYVVKHYWDNIDVDLFHVDAKDTAEQVFADFLMLGALAERQTVRNSYAALLDKISDSEQGGDILLDILFKYLYGSDSPYRDDDLCEDWLGMMLSTFRSPLLKARVSFCLDLAGNCKPGTPAKNFMYITSDGRARSLFDNCGTPLLLVFYSPGCRDCHDYENRLKCSETVRSAVRDGLKILFVCPEGNIEGRHVDRTSSSYIEKAFACDDSVNSESKYMYRSIPSAYLLDRNLNILLKEPSFLNLETGLKELFKERLGIQM